MTKLIARWMEDPSIKNARAVVAYDRKHPMAACTLDQREMQAIEACIAQVRQGADFWEM